MKQMKLFPKWFVILSLILLHRATLTGVLGHGWMMTPVPRSGGGTGTGNASTGAPCGKTGPSTVAATWVRGTNVVVEYARANSHGNTGNTVTLILSYNASTTTPTAAHFDSTKGAIVLAAAATMNVNINGPQQTTLTLPSNMTLGTAVLQFRWNPTSGGSWYDCAYVQIVSSTGGATSVCATNNGGCATTATCAGTTTATCTCKPGYYGDGRTCTRMPDNVQVKLTISGNVSQDTFTSNIAALLQVNVGRVLYDEATVVSGNSVVNFYVAGNPITGEPATNAVSNLRTRVARGDSSLPTSVGYQVLNVQVVGQDTTPLAFGGGDPNSSDDSGSSLSSTTIAIIAGVCAGGVLILVAAFFVMRRRRQSGNNNLYQARHKTSDNQYNVTPLTSMPVKTPPPAATSYSVRNTTIPASTNSTATTHGWRQYTNEQGIPYFFNHITGESRWDSPPEMLSV